MFSLGVPMNVLLLLLLWLPLPSLPGGMDSTLATTFVLSTLVLQLRLLERFVKLDTSTNAGPPGL